MWCIKFYFNKELFKLDTIKVYIFFQYMFSGLELEDLLYIPQSVVALQLYALDFSF